jgi:hypothetical protein
VNKSLNRDLWDYGITMIFVSIKVDYNNPGNPIILVILVLTLYRFPPAMKIAAKEREGGVIFIKPNSESPATGLDKSSPCNERGPAFSLISWRGHWTHD